eukprot:TRINITY_DN4013_c0_g1_i2.p1 TRINITY_DN4013_c0_g1~~TRINITY_DN4013_c0_g1_i2.p1  ORF type:complete len:581 (-),score=164.08 TRINITY_DN4013_c0_g1_i2:69-1811(-)
MSRKPTLLSQLRWLQQLPRLPTCWHKGCGSWGRYIWCGAHPEAVQVGRRHLSSYLLSDSVAPMKNPVDAAAHGTAGTLVVRDPSSSTVIAHFRAHSVPIGCVCFDQSGILVATASVDGHTINVFEIEANHPAGPPSAFRHLYDLSRGITNSIIQDMAFCDWHQWFACVTARGTVHMWKLDGAEAPLSVTRRLSASHDPIQRAPAHNASHPLIATTRIRPTHACSTSATPPNPAEAGALSAREVLKGMSVGFGACCAADLALGSTGTVVLVASPKGIFNRFVVAPEWQSAENGAKELVVTPQTVGTWALSRPKGQEGTATPPVKPAPAPAESDSAAESDWLSQVEVCTFAAESLPLWADPNVKFKAYSHGESALASTILVPWAAAAPHKGGAGVLGALTDQMSSAMSSLMGSVPSPAKAANSTAANVPPALDIAPPAVSSSAPAVNSTAPAAPAAAEEAVGVEGEDDVFGSELDEDDVDHDKVFEDCMDDEHPAAAEDASEATTAEDASEATTPVSEPDEDGKDGAQAEEESKDVVEADEDAKDGNVSGQAIEEESEDERSEEKAVAVSGGKKKKKKKKKR